MKLKVKHTYNPDYSTAPVIGSDVTLSLLTQVKETDYAGNKIYENGKLKRILVDGGYWEDGKYHFFRQDHLGNTRTVQDQDGTFIQRKYYYPFGAGFPENCKENARQPYKYNGKELDQMHRLDWYDYSARHYDPALGRFTTVDPLAEKYYSWSPYAYVMNNPLKYIDPTGMAPDSIQTDYRNNKGEMLFKTNDGLTDVIIVGDLKIVELEKKLKELADKGKIDDPNSNKKELHTLGETPKEYEDHLDYGDTGITLGVKKGYEKGYNGEKRSFIDDVIGLILSSPSPESAAFESAERKGQNMGYTDRKNNRISRINVYSGFKANTPLIELPKSTK
ncbi:RHS repeat-associated protein [Dysgonomonas sp. PFB1-18]|uniref:RHS repeat domain-containing protein n=1 Tax=unclassified Dysgonomonas TaxID=2630389 RepID=UPI002475F30C|nr:MULTISPECIES: RHS repeat-associated core domain-containing protein [unclassified Dysgonomonas]MDH6310482.1 RHS repeat-associated protein [Dysgonomonas sp. PF1-14]MDH6340920.1 RHS repeat-associated protein [Dysgonomonas sp. PF1-16]MDH6382665.1 RHS repeat-associated protein [Dysgonomonas sp. PFB1-18]MDH6399885.1 RHS repeat-associated protein [Dysgonomonas sp. PF1-23]